MTEFDHFRHRPPSLNANRFQNRSLLLTGSSPIQLAPHCLIKLLFCILRRGARLSSAVPEDCPLFCGLAIAEGAMELTYLKA